MHHGSAPISCRYITGVSKYSCDGLGSVCERGSPRLVSRHYIFAHRTITDWYLFSSGYIGEFEEVDDHRSGKIVVQLNGRLNKTGVISPRYNVRLADLEKWVVKLLPARQFGYVILTTSAGIMDHEEARRKHVAGKIIGFFY